MGNSVLKAVFLLTLNILTANLIAQGFQIEGQITDQESGNPIPFATVYLNGTTRGTSTNQMGQFILEEISLPCELILSHVSYELKSIPLQDSTRLEGLNFTMQKRVINLEEATVFRDSVKTDFLERFKLLFLGANYQAEKAEILNDSILVFKVYENDQFSVDAGEAIQVYLPQSGYLVKVDLVHFRLYYKEELGAYHCSILGYYYFDPIDPRSRRARRNLARARVHNYYNSALHFCRSLYHNQLAENGYIFENRCPIEKSSSYSKDYRYNIKAEYADDGFGNKHLKLINTSCKDFLISYHENLSRRPVDISYRDSNRTERKYSGFSFLADTVHILPSGRIPENSILFSGSIGEKGIAYILPEDYIPSMR